MPIRSRLGLTKEPLYLMDGSAFVYRGFYAFQNMVRSDGFPTNALYIVARLILKLLREEKPQHLAFILDGKGGTFRNDLFSAYKAQRSATPEPLIKQFPPILQIIEYLGVPLLVADGFEADDYIASLAMRFREELPVIIVGADKDLRQCLHPSVTLWDPSGKNEKITTFDDFVAETGMQPESWPDFQALIGDSSDNIPGVPQVGPKTGLGLMQDFPTLEALFAGLPTLPPKMQTRFEGMYDLCILYRELTRLRTNTCTDVSLEQLTVKCPNSDVLASFLTQYELRSLAKEVASMQRAGFLGCNEAGIAYGTGANVGSGNASSVGAMSGSLPNIPMTEMHDLPLFFNDEKADFVNPKGTKNGALAQTTLPLVEINNKKVRGQASLFDLPATEAVVTFEQTTDPALLPPFGAHVAVFMHNEQLLLASKNWQRVYTGALPALASYLEQCDARIVGADVKALCTTYTDLWALSFERWFDVSLAAYLVSPEERAYDFMQLAKRFQLLSGSSFEVNATPGLLLLDLQQFFQARLQGLALESVFNDLEIPLVPVLARMEERGITLDKHAFTIFLAEVESELKKLTEKIHGAAGKVFNIRSSQQLGDVLFTVLGLPTAGKTKGGATSTSQESLEKLIGKHPIIDDILEFRTLEKLRSTYLEPLPKITDSKGRLHTTFNQMATATGRLSSRNPNMQNIPIRGAFGQRMRQCFIAAPEKLLVCADYSQIELRVLAHLSKDPTLLDAFKNNEDIHSRTAGLLFDVPLEEVTPTQRRNAKTINFGIVYGMGPQKLGAELHISTKEAKEFIERYFSRFAKLKEFYEDIENKAKEFGFVSTMAGRRRLTPDLVSANNMLRSQARRQAINTRIQGSAADIIKIAMIAVENDPVLASLDAKLLLQIHDELVLEAPKEKAPAAAVQLVKLMSVVAPAGETLDVPLLVDAGVGLTWGDVK